MDNHDSYYGQEKLMKSMDHLMELINDLNGRRFSRYSSLQISDLKKAYNMLRDICFRSEEVNDRIIRVHHTINFKNDFPKVTKYRVGIKTNFFLDGLNLYTGDIVMTWNGEEGMVLNHPLYDDVGKFQKNHLRLIMENRIIDIDPEKPSDVLIDRGKVKPHIKKPYYMLTGNESVNFFEDDAKHMFTIFFDHLIEDTDAEADRRFDEETTDEIIRQLYPEYFD